MYYTPQQADTQYYQGQEPLQPMSQMQRVQQMRDKVQKKLEHFLTDMLVNLYNSKEQAVYEN